MESRVGCVIVGAGIVGCSVAEHLSRIGWRGVVVLDQGPLFEAGGSTSHAPGLVFQTNPSKTMTQLAAYGVERYSGLVSPEECAEKSPLLDPREILGGFYVPSDGLAKGVRVSEAMAREAQGLGAKFYGETEVTGIEVRDGRVRAVETSWGRIETEYV